MGLLMIFAMSSFDFDRITDVHVIDVLLFF